MIRGTRAAVLGGICAALGTVLGGCGSSSSPSSSTAATTAPQSTAPAPAPASTPATKSGGSSTVAVHADPSGRLAYVETSLAANAGRVTIAFTNTSSVPHDVSVEQAGKPLGTTPVISAASNKLVVTLAKGTYTFFCSVDGHRAAGMQGTLTVS